MCSSSIFGPIMDNYRGDLTDIIRASGGGGGGGGTTTTTTYGYGNPTCCSSSSEFVDLSNYHHFSSSSCSSSSSSCNPIIPIMNFSSLLEDPRGTTHTFGDPFSTMRDPFLHDLDFPPPPYFNSNSNNNSAVEDHQAAAFAACSSLVSTQHLLEVHDDMPITAPAPPSCNNNKKKKNAIFSNMIQISPCNNAKLTVSPCDSSPAGIKTSVVNNIAAPNSSRDCLVDNAGVQISSPRNPGLKRRKSQAKKVVCIPAPAAANSRPSSGEVVPSDLWAWRKYGQKPIKGSPYPRGYYRCSSSKGCSARKQVERSRTDPNMLVITYTSEHNHPWPTQRNALAGSTRSQTSKNNNNNNASSKNNSETSSQALNGMSSKPKEEQQQQQADQMSNSDIMSKVVKEETEETEKHELELELENNNIMEDDSNNINNNNTGEFSDGLPYKPSMLECNQSEDFFAQLEEIEADPLNLLFTQDFNEQQQQHQRESKALDPFHLFDWSGDHTSSTNTSSFEEPKRGL